MPLELDTLFVGNYLTAFPISTLDSTSLRDAVGFMARRGIGNLIVNTDESKPLGILTERDILKQIVEKNTLSDVELSEIILTPFVKITPDTSVKRASELIISQKARLLVFADSGNLVGIITPSDLLRAFRKTYVAPPLDDFVSKNVCHMTYDEPILEACKIMYDKRIGSVVVERKDSDYGIFTERDLVFKVLNNKVQLDEPLELYSSFPLITTKDGILANDAASIMALHHIKRLALTCDEKIVGVVTVRDIVDAYQSDTPQIRNY